MTEYVTTADALFFHKELIAQYGGALESALHRPQTRYYETIVHKAAALFESLIKNHPLADGNKRVAFAVVDVFLRINGHRLTADSQSVHEFMMTLFERQTFDMEHLVPWLQTHVEGRQFDSRSGK